MDDMYIVVSVGLCVFAFLAILLGIGEFYGGSWTVVAQGIASFMLIIVAFAFGAIVLIRLLGRR